MKADKLKMKKDVSLFMFLMVWVTMFGDNLPQILVDFLVRSDPSVKILSTVHKDSVALREINLLHEFLEHRLVLLRSHCGCSQWSV